MSFPGWQYSVCIIPHWGPGGGHTIHDSTWRGSPEALHLSFCPTLPCVSLPLADFLYSFSVIHHEFKSFQCVLESRELSKPRMIVGVSEFVAGWFEVKVVLGTHEFIFSLKRGQSCRDSSLKLYSWLNSLHRTTSFLKHHLSTIYLTDVLFS